MNSGHFGRCGAIFRNKAFTRFARKAGLGDATLCEAIRDAERGLIAADLGGGEIKQRIARPGQGKSGGYRTLIIFKMRARALFVHGFAKRNRTTSGTFIEVMCDAQTIP